MVITVPQVVLRQKYVSVPLCLFSISVQRRSLHYTEVKHSQLPKEDVPKDSEAVLYSEVNIDEVMACNMLV